MIEKTAIFSPCRQYRYSLSRFWIITKPFVLFVCLNPSTADENVDDPTIRRCIRYADSWGYGGMVMVNLYGYRSTDPKKLHEISDPVGPDNDKHIKLNTRLAEKTIAAWGTVGGKVMRSDKVMWMLENTHYLKMTKNGHPSHPLYLKNNLKPIPY